MITLSTHFAYQWHSVQGKSAGLYSSPASPSRQPSPPHALHYAPHGKAAMHT